MGYPRLASVLCFFLAACTGPSPSDHQPDFSAKEAAAEEGTLIVGFADAPDGRTQTNYHLHAKTGEYIDLVVGENQKAAVNRLAGLKTTVSGLVSADKKAILVQATEEVPVNESLQTVSEQRTAVLLVNFDDNKNTIGTAAQIQRTIFDPTNPLSVTSFMLESSYGRSAVVGDIFGYFTLPVATRLATDPCSISSIAMLAQNAARAAGVDLSGYQRLVYVFPWITCAGVQASFGTWAGYGTYGGSPSQIWMNGYNDAMRFAHEMGHNLGLRHSHSLNCGSQVVGTNCQSVDYGDPTDLMGTGVLGGWGHFTAFQKELLGWLSDTTAPRLQTITTSGTYTIDTFAQVGSLPKALRIPRTGTSEYFYVETRKAVGFDKSVAFSILNAGGVVVHTGKPGDMESSFILNVTPATATVGDAALAVGSSFVDPVSKIEIKTLASDATSATVQVNLGGTSACVPNPPEVSFTQSAVSVLAGGAVTYTLSIRNTNASACGSSTFQVGGTLPSLLWTLTAAPSSLTLAPGASQNVSVRVTSPLVIGVGSYLIGFSVRDTQRQSATPFNATFGIASPAPVPSPLPTPTPAPSPDPQIGPFVFKDEFTRSNSQILDNGWTEVLGSMNILDGELQSDRVLGSHMAIQSTLIGKKQVVQARFAKVIGDYSPSFGLVLRFQDHSNYYLLRRDTGAASLLRIFRVKNGVATELKRQSLSNPSLDWFSLIATADGPTLTLEIPDGAKTSVTDSTFSSGAVGISVNVLRPLHIRIDDFSVHLDN